SAHPDEFSVRTRPRVIERDRPAPLADPTGYARPRAVDTGRNARRSRRSVGLRRPPVCVTSHEFRERLSGRAENAGVTITADAQATLEAYFQLLARWNAKINLTALPLRRPSDETFDRLLIEPLAAARHIAESA